jgi:hypothetical protein
VSAKVNLGVTLGSLTLLVIIGVVVITGSKANEEAALQAKINSEEAKQQSIQNNINLDKQHKALTDFVDKWQNRVNVSNKINNGTQSKIDAATQNILTNLTSHRAITNDTFGKLTDFINDRNVAFNQTLDKLDNITTQNKQLIIAFNATNEEERVKAVDRIIEQLHADHQVIMKGLNISSTDNQTEASDGIDQLKRAIEALEKKTFTPPGLAKK